LFFHQKKKANHLEMCLSWITLCFPVETAFVKDWLANNSAQWAHHASLITFSIISRARTALFLFYYRSFKEKKCFLGGSMFLIICYCYYVFTCCAALQHPLFKPLSRILKALFCRFFFTVVSPSLFTINSGKCNKSTFSSKQTAPFFLPVQGRTISSKYSALLVLQYNLSSAIIF